MNSRTATYRARKLAEGLCIWGGCWAETGGAHYCEQHRGHVNAMRTARKSRRYLNQDAVTGRYRWACRRCGALSVPPRASSGWCALCDVLASPWSRHVLSGRPSSDRLAVRVGSMPQHGHE